eukprot:COSAG05_NODE_9845_length_598_cov_0.569138_1_plen_44_part_10
MLLLGAAALTLRTCAARSQGPVRGNDVRVLARAGGRLQRDRGRV